MELEDLDSGDFQTTRKSCSTYFYEFSGVYESKDNKEGATEKRSVVIKAEFVIPDGDAKGFGLVLSFGSCPWCRSICSYIC